MCVFRVFEHGQYIAVRLLSVYTCVCVCMYLEGSHAQLNTEAQVNTEVVGQKIEEHVVSTKQRDEEEGGLSQPSVAQKEKKQDAGGEATSGSCLVHVLSECSSG